MDPNEYNKKLKNIQKNKERERKKVSLLLCHLLPSGRAESTDRLGRGRQLCSGD